MLHFTFNFAHQVGHIKFDLHKEYLVLYGSRCSYLFFGTYKVLYFGIKTFLYVMHIKQLKRLKCASLKLLRITIYGSMKPALMPVYVCILIPLPCINTPLVSKRSHYLSGPPFDQTFYLIHHIKQFALT